jgi:hypothetical protein
MGRLLPLIAAAALATVGPASAANAAHAHLTAVGAPLTVTVPAALASAHATTHSRGTRRVVVRVQHDATARQIRLITSGGVIIAHGADGGFDPVGTLGAGARAFVWGRARAGTAVRVWTPALNTARTLRAVTPALTCAPAVGSSTAVAGPFAVTIPHGVRPGGKKIAAGARASIFGSPLRIATTKGVVLGRDTRATRVQGGFALAGAVFAYGTLGGVPALWTAKLGARSTALVQTRFAPCIPGTAPAAGTGTITLRGAGADAGRFVLEVDGGARTAGSPVTLSPGTHTVAEAPGAGIDLGDYTSRIHCTESRAASVIDSGDAGPLGVPVAIGDAWVCTITNAKTLTHTLRGLAVTSAPDVARRTTKTIGALGGTVATDGADGTHYVLRVPPGALSAETAISIAPATVTGFGAIATATPYAVEFGPSGLAFAVPATLSITPPAVAAPAPDFALTSEPGNAGVGVVPIFAGPGGSLTIEVAHFSSVATIKATLDSAHALSAALAAAHGALYARVSTDLVGFPGSSSALATDLMAIETSTVAPDVAHSGDDLSHFFLAERALLDWDAVLAEDPAIAGLPSGITTTPTLGDVNDAVLRDFLKDADALLAAWSSPACTGTPVNDVTDWVATPIAIDGDLSGYFGQQLPEPSLCIAAVAEPLSFPDSIDASQQLIEASLRGEIVAPAGTPGADGTGAGGHAIFTQPTVFDLSATGAAFTGSGLHLGPTTATSGLLSFELDRGADEPSRAPRATIDGTASVGGLWADIADATSGLVDVNVPVHLTTGPPTAVHVAFQTPPTKAILAPGATTHLCVAVTDAEHQPIPNLILTLELDGPGSVPSSSPKTDLSGITCFDYQDPSGVVTRGDTATITATATHGSDQGADSTVLTPRWAAIALETSSDGVTFAPSTNTTVAVAPGTIVTLRPTITVPGATASAPPVPAAGEIAQIDVDSGGGTLSNADVGPGTVVLPLLDAAGQTLVSWDPGVTTADTTLRVSFPSPGLGLAGIFATVTIVQRVPAVVTVGPDPVTVDPHDQTTFAAIVTGPANHAVTWTATGGTIDADGVYTAGATPGVYAVTATSVADPSAHDSATVTIAGPGIVTRLNNEVIMFGGWEPGSAGGPDLCEPFDEPPFGSVTTWDKTDQCGGTKTKSDGSTATGFGSAHLALTESYSGGALAGVKASTETTANASVCFCGGAGAEATADGSTQYLLTFEASGPTTATIHESMSTTGTVPDTTVEVDCGNANHSLVPPPPNGGSIDQTVNVPPGNRCTALLRALSKSADCEPQQFCGFSKLAPQTAVADVEITFAPGP